MALLGFNLPRIADSSTSKNKEIQEIKEYLHQLTEQLRYILQNIDEDNFNSGFSDALSSEIKNQLSAADAISRNISSSVNTLSSKISSVEGDISNLVVGLNSKVTKPETLVQDDMLIYTGEDWATIQRSELGSGGTGTTPTKTSELENDSGFVSGNAPDDDDGVETITADFKTSNGGSIKFGKEGKNSGTMIRLDQEDGTPRLMFRSSKIQGAMVWEQPEEGAEVYFDLGAGGIDYRRIKMPKTGGTLTHANDVLELVYPVGSIYMSVNNTDPGTIIGGTWERLQDRFLLGASDTYGAGTTGGESKHTLTINEMPAHTHKFAWHDAGQSASSNKITLDSSAVESTSSKKWRETNGDLILNNGGGQGHNNMPPYLAVYMWTRTA